MRNILALIGAVVVLVVGGGWYLGWYQFGTQPGADGHRTINVDVNTPKIIEDEKKVQQKVSGVISGQTNGTPTPPPSTDEKKVQGTPTGLQQNPDGSWTINSQFKVIGQ